MELDTQPMDPDCAAVDVATSQGRRSVGIGPWGLFWDSREVENGFPAKF